MIMRSLFSVKIDGFAEIAQELRSFPDAIGESALRQACVAGAAIIRDEAVLRAPVKSGVLKSDIIMRHIDEASDGASYQTYYVTVRGGARGADGKKDASHDAFYWRWVEEGHRYVPRAASVSTTFTQTLSSGKVVVRSRKRAASSLKVRRRASAAMEAEFGTSKVGAKPFMRPAFESRIGDALTAARNKLAECVGQALSEMSR
jgi:HK97 gp10 family phage protein